MNTAGDDSAVLYAAYVDEAEQYTAALRLVGETAAACRRGETIEDRLGRVLSLLSEIAARDAQLVPVKQRWEQAGRPTNEGLRSIMDHIAVLIRQIQNELQTVEQAVQSRRDQLADQLDVCNRRYRMQRAYQGKS